MYALPVLPEELQQLVADMTAHSHLSTEWKHDDVMLYEALNLVI